MSRILSDFVERRLSLLPRVPPEWLPGSGEHFQLNLRMCQITNLNYDFTWGDRSYDSAIGNPHKILQLDVSLNDLAALDHKQLLYFTQLRALNASLNRISRFIGVETLKQLRVLDLSHNVITKLHGLESLKALTHLNLSMNQLSSIADMPTLPQLRELYLGNNKLKLLDGLQGLPSLQELHIQGNFIIDLVPIASNFQLRALNAADNGIKDLFRTLDVFQDLKRLQSVNLHGNPLEQDPQYQSKLIMSTSITILDNVNVRPRPKNQDKYNQSLVSIKEYTRQSFMEHIADKRQLMEEEINFLKKRILAIQDDFHQYERKGLGDLDTCLRHMDSLSMDDAYKYSSKVIGDKSFQPLDRSDEYKMASKFGASNPMTDDEFYDSDPESVAPVSATQPSRQYSTDPAYERQPSQHHKPRNTSQHPIMDGRKPDYRSYELNQAEPQHKNRNPPHQPYTPYQFEPQYEQDSKDRTQKMKPVKRPKADYSGVRQTDDVLRCAYNELNRELEITNVKKPTKKPV